MEERTDSDRRIASAVRRFVGALRPIPSAFRSTAARRIGLGLLVLAVAVVGVVAGVLLGARTETDVGPFRAEMSIMPSLVGDTEVAIPPLGSLHLNSHDGPVHLNVSLGALDPGRTEALIDDPAGITRASQTAVTDVRQGLIQLAMRTVGVSVLFAMALAALVFRNVRRVAWSGVLALAIVGGSLGSAIATIHPDSIEEPRYEGLLVNAPAVVGDARQIANDYGKYAEQLQQLVANVSRIYTTVSTLPVYQPAEGTTRVLHVSDLHLNPTTWPMMRTVVEQFGIEAVIDTGDITDWGSEPEASYVASIGLLKVPYVFIRGNHDSAATGAAVARQRNAIVLDNSITNVAGLTIAGIGDPRFTPDKATSPAGSGASKQTIEQVIGAGEQLAATIRGSGQPVDIALVHDPASAGALSGTCPLVLAGHTHSRDVRTLDQVPGQMATRLMVEGSTGGAGLRGLEKEEPQPLVMSVLYFDSETRALQAYDDIKVGGTGQSQVTLERKVIEDEQVAPAEGQRPAPTPTR
ncbi:metallophosphoesterase family protein [Phytohabitans kaempferiae]|uniref:Metallophosphoesterase n=1 Tax=Phytohabitans kaempferiae TaxID=1620943 RepID=A0ABV6M6L1_9ACTN